jgi:hypothetical protein
LLAIPHQPYTYPNRLQNAQATREFRYETLFLKTRSQRTKSTSQDSAQTRIARFLFSKTRTRFQNRSLVSAPLLKIGFFEMMVNSLCGASPLVLLPPSPRFPPGAPGFLLSIEHFPPYILDGRGITMLKFIIGLLVLFVICVAAGVFRKMRGGRFLPAPERIDGRDEPQSLRDLAQRRQREKRAKTQP